ncbi:uncharacterized protein PV09_07565 [Verruconis gallopava]|uniref:Copper homeostasis protein cutC homolog n=1 Tax=Verruconis gallopava TaxID=253628 RepID=A0A0D1XFU5_9PEZI|nr:uncharacterized protein PV09_07565 [Verruconis gallopava]KIW01051.1 hypothetical protein PV09_07565 [Verruconis gallopava]
MPNAARFLEVACFSPESAFIAADAGAHRIELCGGPFSSGGLTPSLTDLQAVKKATEIPVHVMIRPRAGRFVYTSDEIGTMMQSIAAMKEWADAFVFGVLSDDGKLDVEQCKQLLSAAGDTPCVFHRAVECVNDSGQVYDLIKELGFSGVLTGGRSSAAVNSVAELTELTQRHETSGLQIILGGGIRACNVRTLLKHTSAKWYHTSALVNGQSIASFDEISQLLGIIADGRN